MAVYLQLMMQLPEPNSLLRLMSDFARFTWLAVPMEGCMLPICTGDLYNMDPMSRLICENKPLNENLSDLLTWAGFGELSAKISPKGLLWRNHLLLKNFRLHQPVN